MALSSNFFGSSIVKSLGVNMKFVILTLYTGLTYSSFFFLGSPVLLINVKLPMPILLRTGGGKDMAVARQSNRSLGSKEACTASCVLLCMGPPYVSELWRNLALAGTLANG